MSNSEANLKAYYEDNVSGGGDEDNIVAFPTHEHRTQNTQEIQPSYVRLIVIMARRLIAITSNFRGKYNAAKNHTALLQLEKAATHFYSRGKSMFSGSVTIGDILNAFQTGIKLTSKRGLHVFGKNATENLNEQYIERALTILSAGFMMWLVFYIITLLWHYVSLTVTAAVVTVTLAWLSSSTTLFASLQSRLPWKSVRLTAFAGALVLWMLFYIYSPPRTIKPELATSRRVGALVQSQNIPCLAPTTVFQPWEINTILPDSSGKPVPIEYTLEHGTPHRLSVVDIDALDMQLEVWVDGVLRGLTSDFELDKSVNCGEDLRSCIVEKKFSSGMVVIGPGKHTIRIVWAGKEFLPGTADIDWGAERIRRFAWQREYCS